MKQSDHLEIGAYDARLAAIQAVPRKGLHALSVLVGWPHREGDWQLLGEVGQGFAALDRIGRVIGSAMWFPCGDHHATVGMVITVPRLQANGTGSWLMQQVLREAEGRTLRLNATRAAERLYGQLGFKIDRAVFQRQGSARLPEGSAKEGSELVRPLEDQDVPAVVELDARAFGARRETILRALLDRSSGCGLFRSGRLEAFALCREFGRGHVIGPAVAGNDADAIAVVASHVRSRADGFTRLDTFAEGTRFARFLQACGLQVFDTVSGMSLADRPWVGGRGGEGEPVTYALASHAFG